MARRGEETSLAASDRQTDRLTAAGLPNCAVLVTNYVRMRTLINIALLQSPGGWLENVYFSRFQHCCTNRTYFKRPRSNDLNFIIARCFFLARSQCF